MRVKPIVLSALLVSASAPLGAEEDMPSMDFIEYLGAYEKQVDDEWLNPIQLEQDSQAIADNNQGEDKTDD